MNKSNTNTLLVNKNNKIKDYYLKKVHLLETYDIDGKKILVEENTLNSYLLLKEFKEGIICKLCVERVGVDYGIFRV